MNYHYTYKNDGQSAVQSMPHIIYHFGSFFESGEPILSFIFPYRLCSQPVPPPFALLLTSSLDDGPARCLRVLSPASFSSKAEAQPWFHRDCMSLIRICSFTESSLMDVHLLTHSSRPRSQELELMSSFLSSRS